MRTLPIPTVGFITVAIEGPKTGPTYRQGLNVKKGKSGSFRVYWHRGDMQFRLKFDAGDVENIKSASIAFLKTYGYPGGYGEAIRTWKAKYK